MESLRKVKFFIKNPLEYIGETMLSGDPTEEETKERIGVFHKWGNKLIPDLENEQTFVVKLRIVEEQDTGKVFMINPENITFIK